MIYTTKLKSIVLSFFIIAITVFGTVHLSRAKSEDSKTTETSPKIGYTIVLDAGHGGIDPGSIGKTTKVTESELNLIFVNKLEHLLLSSGIDVVKTRKDEHGLYGIYSRDYKIRDMQARKQIIDNSNANLVVSIHMNSFNQTSRRGAQVFYDEGNEFSSIIAMEIQNCFAKDLPESDRGISLGDYYILKCNSKIPSVLCECGYLSNADDEKLLIQNEYQDKVVYSIYKGIISYLNTKI